MSLLKRNKDKQLAAEKELAAQHVIVKMGVDRDVREAYFLGLAFAAIANDDVIDAVERVRLMELGKTFEISAEVISEIFRYLEEADDDAKMATIQECARQLTEVPVAECFLKEFEEIWLLGGGPKDELEEFVSRMINWTGEKMRLAVEAKKVAAVEAKRRAAKREARRKRKMKQRAERKREYWQNLMLEYNLRDVNHDWI